MATFRTLKKILYSPLGSNSCILPEISLDYWSEMNLFTYYEGSEMRINASIVLLVSCLLVPAHGHGKIFDGNPKIILATRTSIEGTKYLMHWMESYLGEENHFAYVNFNGRYSGLKYEDDQLVFDSDGMKNWLSNIKDQVAVVREDLGSDAEIIFIAQSGVGLPDIATATDEAGIKKSADEIEVMCDSIKAAGADHIFWSTMHYGIRHNSRFPWNEPLVVQEFNSRNNGYTGIDMITPVHKDYPYTSCGDLIHSTEYVKMLWSMEYLKAFIEHDGKEPLGSWAQDSLNNQLNLIKGFRDQLRLVSPRKGKYKIGDTIHVKWECDCELFAEEFDVQLRTRDFTTEPMTRHEYTTTFKLGNAKVPCTDKGYDFVVTENMFNNSWSKEGQAIPVFAMLKSRRCYIEGQNEAGVNSCFWAESNEDWFRPDSMIMLYPDTDRIDESRPVYGPPRPVYPLEGLTVFEGSSVAQPAPTGKRIISQAPRLAEWMYDAQGRRIGITEDLRQTLTPGVYLSGEARNGRLILMNVDR